MKGQTDQCVFTGTRMLGEIFFLQLNAVCGVAQESHLISACVSDVRFVAYVKFIFYNITVSEETVFREEDS